LGLALDAGVAGVSLDVEGRDSRGGAHAGNLLLGGSFTWTAAPALELRVCVRAGAPLATYPGGIEENRLAELDYLIALNAQGLREPFVWLTNVVPVVLDARAAWRAHPRLTLVGLLAPAALLSVNQRPSRVALSARADGFLSAGPIFGRLGVAYFLSSLALENAEHDQLSLGAGVGVEAAAQRLSLDLALGLDAPYGVGVPHPAPSWGIALVADLRFGRASGEPD
jgi:hypothetical protein